MKHTRRRLLQRASQLSILLVGASAPAAASTDCSGIQLWDTERTYTDGDQVLYDGSLWKAKWWTTGDTPGTKQWGPWNEVGSCRGGTGVNAAITASKTFVQPDEAVEFSAADSTGTIESYVWDFDGGGADATGETATHSYSATGEQMVTLTITDTNGYTDSVTETIRVSEDSGFPERFFAPYVDVTLADQDPLIDSVEKAGTKWFILAFITADQQGQPAWAGTQAVGEPSDWLDVGTQIQTLRRDAGGDVIISFGGLQGTYLPETTNSAVELKNKYARVIDTYDVTFLDFDEEKLVRNNHEKVSLRNEALVLLKDEYPNLRLSYTLPVMPDGFPSHSTNDILFALEDAAEKGLAIDVVNPMTMNYGSSHTLNGDTVISAAESVHQQLGNLWPEKTAAQRWNMIGLTPMIGENDTGQIFYQEDARQVREFGVQQNLGLLSFWELVRDDGEGNQLYNSSMIEQQPYEFSHIFNQVQ